MVTDIGVSSSPSVEGRAWLVVLRAAQTFVLCSLSGHSGSLLQILASWPRLWDTGLGQTFRLWVEIRK